MMPTGWFILLKKRKSLSSHAEIIIIIKVTKNASLFLIVFVIFDVERFVEFFVFNLFLLCLISREKEIFFPNIVTLRIEITLIRLKGIQNDWNISRDCNSIGIAIR